MASCAVCREPLRRGEAKAVAGSEVFHRACVGNLEHSVVNELKKDNLQLKVENERLRSAVRAATDGAAAEGEKHGETLVKLRGLRVELEKANRQRAEFAESAMADRRRAVYLERGIGDIKIERDQAIAARDAARTEAALHQTIRGVSPAAAPTEEPVVDERDSTEVRFSLLELDLE